MMRRLYSLLLTLLTPLILLRLWWRGRQQPEYRQHIGERFGGISGHYPPAPGARLIWVHAVSVGETRAAQPLIEALQAQWPDHRILLTCMTPTGRATGCEVYGERVLQAYLPYDLPFAVDRFFDHFSPAFGILMETEIWPNLLAAAQRRRVPVVLVNARLSARSARGYGRFAALLRPAFASLRAVAAQTAADAERLRALGAPAVTVCGNLKFDVVPPAGLLTLGQSWRAALAGRAVWLAASTRDGEEVLLLDAWLAQRHAASAVDDGGAAAAKSGSAAAPATQADADGRAPDRPAPLLVIVPRHPQRFAEVAQLLEQRGVHHQRRSTALPDATTEVWLGDSMGEMAAYYALADLAFIGGSLLPLGGQNLIEAAACGCPVLVGPHTFNFLRATEDAIDAGAARRVADAQELLFAVNRLLTAKSTDDDQLQQMRQASRAFATAHRGATARTLALIDSALAASPAAR